MIVVKAIVEPPVGSSEAFAGDGAGVFAGPWPLESSLSTRHRDAPCRKEEKNPGLGSELR